MKSVNDSQGAPHVLRRVGYGVILAIGICGSNRAAAAEIRVPQDFARIQDAVNSAAPGDTILVRGPEDEGAGEAVFEENIVLAKPVTLSWNRGFDGGYIRPTIRARDPRQPAVTMANASKAALIGFVIQNTNGVGVWVSRVQDLLIRDCVIEQSRVGLEFDRRMNHGVRDGRIFNNEIRSNRICGVGTAWNHGREWLFHHNRLEGNRVGLLAVPGPSTSAALTARINDNEVLENDLAGLWITGKPGALELRRNRIYDNRQCGVVIQHAQMLRLENNLILGNELGLWLYQNPGASRIPAGSVANNVVAWNDETGIKLTAWQGAPGLRLVNNIVAWNGGYGLLAQTWPFRGRLAYNDVFENDRGNYGGLLPNMTGRQGNLAMDPLFLDEDGTASGNYHLRSASPCLHAGDSAAMYDNFDGTRNDMGAYGGPQRQPVLGWAVGGRNLASLYMDHGRGEIMQVYSNRDSMILCRANPFNGGVWVATRRFQGSSVTGDVVALDRQGRELQRFTGFSAAQNVWQNLELSVDPRDGACWVADPKNWDWPETPGRLVKLTLDGRMPVDLSIPELTDVEVVKSNGLVAVSAGETQAVVRFFSAAGSMLTSVTVCADTAIGLAVNPHDRSLTMIADRHWARLSLDSPGTILDVSSAYVGPRSSSVTVDPRSGRSLVTAFAEEDTRLSLHNATGMVLRCYDEQERNSSPILSSECDVDPRNPFFVGAAWLWDARAHRWFDGIAFLDPELAEPVFLLDFRCDSVSLLRPRIGR